MSQSRSALGGISGGTFARVSQERPKLKRGLRVALVGVGPMAFDFQLFLSFRFPTQSFSSRAQNERAATTRVIDNNVSRPLKAD